jgi:hypothetical protein
MAHFLPGRTLLDVVDFQRLIPQAAARLSTTVVGNNPGGIQLAW